MKSELNRYRRTVACAFVLTIAVATSSIAAPVGNAVDVTIDFAKVLKLDRPAATIVIGNTGIADASIQDEQTIVLTGKTAGTTNLIVLDEKGAEVMNSVVRVSSDTRQLTTVFKQNQRQTFSCAPVCEQVISVGDEVTAFDKAKTQIEARQAFSTAQ